MENKFSSLPNDLLLTFYKQSVSYYECRKFILPSGQTIDATPEELATEIEYRMTNENATIQ